jgi:membrane-associated phospholipid phosphatase
MYNDGLPGRHAGNPGRALYEQSRRFVLRRRPARVGIPNKRTFAACDCPVLTKMNSVLATPLGALRRTKTFTALRASEGIALAYFAYLPCLGVARRLGLGPLLLLASLPLALWAIWQAQSRSHRRSVAVARDWWPLALILVGYWAMGWFTSPPNSALEIELIRWDRLLLYDAHLKACVESAGSVFPATLETIYLLLYAIPPVCLGILYACGERSQAPRFLLFLFAGTFTTDALLPYVSVISPRIAFPGADLPHYKGVAWGITAWLLDRFDISTSVLPSGHVAVALSSALGMAAALPRRPIFGRCALGLAGLVYLATIYCRYHYAVDGLISIVVVCAVCRVASWTSHA